VVQRLAGYLAVEEQVGVNGDGDSRESQAARSEAASEFLSYLKLSEIYLTKGATAAEVEVVGTCVYYYLPEAAHDARSRIGICSVFSSEALSQIGSARASCSVGQTSGMWALPRVWRRERFIVQCPLVGDAARIWIASSQIAVRMLQFSYVDVRRRRSDNLRQRQPGSEEGRRRGLCCDTLFTGKPHASNCQE
jgi:hypothetical protein